MSTYSPTEIKSALWFAAETGQPGILAPYAQPHPGRITPNNRDFANDIDYAKVKSLIDSRDPNDHGNTALHKAVLHGNPHIIKLLLNMGTSINVTNHAGQTPLDLSFEYGYGALLAERVPTAKPQQAMFTKSVDPRNAPSPTKQNSRTPLGLTLAFTGMLSISIAFILMEFALLPLAITAFVTSPFILVSALLVMITPCSVTADQSPMTTPAAPLVKEPKVATFHVAAQPSLGYQTTASAAVTTPVAPTAQVPQAAKVVAATAEATTHDPYAELQQAVRETAINMHEMAEGLHEHQLMTAPVLA